MRCAVLRVLFAPRLYCCWQSKLSAPSKQFVSSYFLQCEALEERAQAADNSAASAEEVASAAMRSAESAVREEMEVRPCYEGSCWSSAVVGGHLESSLFLCLMEAMQPQVCRRTVMELPCTRLRSLLAGIGAGPCHEGRC